MNICYTFILCIALGVCGERIYNHGSGSNKLQGSKDGFDVKLFDSQVKTAKSGVSFCTLKPVTGMCRGYFNRFFYNATSRKCENFVYGGCDSNRNNFETEEDCNITCILPLCTKTDKFFYNPKSKKCEDFVYGGCGANTNNFDTKEKCQIYCSDQCRDNSEDCLLYRGYCDTRKMVKKHCKKTCGACVSGNWGSWNPPTQCSVTCGDGKISRKRNCDDPPPKDGGNQCLTTNGTMRLEEIEIYDCSMKECSVTVVDGDWGDWSPWTECSVACGDGQVSRERNCDNPAPKHNGNECVRKSGTKSLREVEKSSCSLKECPVDVVNGNWGSWSPATECSTTCGNGQETRHRVCDNPAPKNDGNECVTKAGTKALNEVKRSDCSVKRCPGVSNACGVAPKGTHFIPSGTAIMKRFYPWQVAIYYQTHFRCSGVLIGNRHVLTAAHCVSAKGRFKRKRVRVGVGQYNFNEGTGKRLRVKVNIHPSYNKWTRKNDIAILKVFHLVLPDNVRHICLPNAEEELQRGLNCSTTGWGKMSGHMKSILHEERVNITTNQECNRKNAFQMESCSCIKDGGGPVSCMDSRGIWTVHGIVSRGTPKCQGHVVTKVSAYRSWIDRRINYM